MKIPDTPLDLLREPLRGIVTPASGEMPFEVTRWKPTARVAPFVHQLWQVRWSLPEGRTHVQHTLPDPVVHEVFEGGACNIQGPMSTRFERVLEGSGRVLGIRFRPAAYRLLSDDVWALRDRRVPVTADVEATPEAVCAWLAQRVPDDLPEALCELRDVAERMSTDRSLTRVAQVARLVGVSERTLQRRFKDAVGWTPLEVLRRRRVQDLLARLDAGDADLGDLAYALGYADQAHLCRDFKGLVGRTPTAYQRSRAYQPPPGPP